VKHRKKGNLFKHKETLSVICLQVTKYLQKDWRNRKKKLSKKLKPEFFKTINPKS
jgi:hypothetical protein